MNRFGVGSVILVVLGVMGCGNFGGGGSSGGGTGIAPIGSGPQGPGGTGAWVPTNVTRSTSYAFNLVYSPNQAAGGAISAIGVAPTTTECWLGISPLGEVDHLSNQGVTTETAFVFDVSSFAIIGSNVYAATSNTVAALAGAVYSRDPVSAAWSLSLNGSENECVAVAYMNKIYAFQGMNDGLPATVSVLDSASSTWTNIASLGSAVPAAVTVFNGEMWCGGRTNKGTGGGAVLAHGNGSAFTPVTVSTPTFPGQVASVMALCEANNTLFVSVEVRDTLSGATIGGDLYYYDAVKGLVNVDQMQNDAAICLAAADGTIYAGTRGGKLLWLDTKGKWQQEANVPTNLGVTAIAWNGVELEVGVRTDAGAQLYAREATGSTPPAANGMMFTSIAPATGPMAGGTAVTIMGKGFTGVTVVKVGGVPLSNLVVVSDTQITGKTGAGTAGAADVVITSSTGSVTGRGAFTFQGASLSYATDIQPGIMQNCSIAGCHATLYPFGSYNSVVNGMAMTSSPAGTPYVVPGNVAGSYLAQKMDAKYAVSSTLLGADMAIHDPALVGPIETWISQGAKP
jgi:hypothetical protein